MSIKLSYPDGRITLIHPPPPEDDLNTHLLYTHPHILKYLPFWTPENQSLQSVTAKRAARTLDSDHFRQFAIYRINSHHNNEVAASSGPQLPEFLGTIGFVYIQRHFDSSELGIILQPDAHRAGYAAEAIYLLLDHGFTLMEAGGLGFNRVIFTTAAMNTPMRGWLERALEATQESTQREAWKTATGEYIDAVVYSILRREWVGGVKGKLAERVDRAIAKSKRGADATL
ncbi:hypothetical protein FRB96_000614 [Tulasnella sp. 330]|nr:hypothetical protein FRB96_000614 [Tulasnella sp. 330]